jgi:hypothetical protein
VSPGCAALGLIDPWTFVRLVTLSLALTWGTFGLLRLGRRVRRWRERFACLGLEARWWRRQALVVCLRVTVLDPVNLALLCALLALWTLPRLAT